MAKLYRTSGAGNAQQTLDVNDEKIKIYADDASLDADLANIGENEIVATNEEDSQRAGTQYPVDIVQDDNMNAVTSNAVAQALKGNKQELYNDNDARITMYRMGPLALFTIRSKRVGTFNYTIPEVYYDDALCDTLINSATVVGETYISNATTLVVNHTGTSYTLGSGQILALLK